MEVGPVSSVQLTFSESINTSSFTTADIVSFIGPQGAIPITALSSVAGSNDQTFEISFAPLTELGTYSMVIGPNISDGAGNLMNQDRDAQNGETTQDRYTLTFTVADLHIFSATDVPVPINDWNTARSYLTVNEDLPGSDAR